MPNVLILANSYKGGRGRRCVAGIEIESGNWLRPVGDTRDGELTAAQTVATRKNVVREARPLDVVSMRLGRDSPSIHHPEDVLRGSDEWRRRISWTVDDLLDEFPDHLSPGPRLLGSRSDKLTLPEIKTLGSRHSSLTLVRPGKVKFWVKTFEDRRQLRVTFSLAHQRYDLSVTDTRYGADNPPDDGDHVLTVSLAVPWQPDWADQPFCYKIVAGVMPVG